MLLQVELQLLDVCLLRRQDHALELDIGGQGLQRFGVGLDFRLGVLAELEEGVLQGVGPVGPPVQEGAAVLPLFLHGGVVQIAAHGQVSYGVLLVVEGHDGLADASVAAVVLEAVFRLVVLDFALVAGDAPLVALGQVVDGPAEGRVAPEQVDVPARQVQDVSGHSGEDVQVGNQFAQAILVKKYVHF